MDALRAVQEVERREGRGSGVDWNGRGCRYVQVCRNPHNISPRSEFVRLLQVCRLADLAPKVIRTRLRQPLVDGKVKYTGLVQTLRLIVAEEGVRSLYGGLSAHLMRVIPNAAVMYSIYEAVLRMS